MVKILDEVQQKAIYNGWLTGASKQHWPNSST